MHRKRFAITACIAFVTGAAAVTAAFAQDVSIRLGHVLSDGHSWHQAAQGFADEVAEKTEGRVGIEVFPSGQLGSEQDMVEGMQFGSVQAAVIGSGSFQFVEPKMGIIEMPYAWQSRDQAFAALDGELGTALAGLLEPHGVRVLSWWENGYRHVTNNVRPIETPADLEGLKIRVTPDKIRLATFEALGAEPAPLSFGELYSALQQGVFDAQENPLPIIETASFFEVQDYLSLTGHVWGAASLVISDMVWQQISEDDRTIVQDAARHWAEEQRAMIGASSEELRAKLEEQGMKVNDVDIAPFVEAVQPVWESQADTYGEELMGIIEQYRQ